MLPSLFKPVRYIVCLFVTVKSTLEGVHDSWLVCRGEDQLPCSIRCFQPVTQALVTPSGMQLELGCNAAHKACVETLITALQNGATAT
ncbi:hypothetical protein SVAN01_10705 [Stagonosporopsis vannaccii]|nr:hypothetical protein SVAN01_10705 [Stagonosporopsis vannaccii]